MTAASHQASPRDVMRFLALLARPGDVFELRALSKRYGKQQITSGYFDDLELLVDAAVTRSGTDDGVYITLNPVHPGLLCRTPKNRVQIAGSGDTSSDRDIPARRHLLIDIDPVRPAGISSDDAEHAAALALVEQVAVELTALGWPRPLIADSGNGGHLIYAIDLPRDDDHLVQRVLKQLSKRYSSPTLKLDESVHNPARISKVYGTLTCKGLDEPERPHRVSRILEAPAELVVVTREQLEAYAPRPTPVPSRATSGATRTDYPKFDLEGWIATHIPGAEVQAWDGGEGGKRKWILPACPFDSTHDRGEACIVEMHSGAISASCKHDSCFRTWQELRERLEPKAERPRNGHGANGSRTSIRTPPDNVLYEDEDYSAAQAAEAAEYAAIAAREDAPAPAKLPDRTWEDCVAEIYARKDEPWIEILVGEVVIATCRPGSFVPLVAPSGSGKSSLVIQMLVEHALHRGPAVYLTYELDGDEAVARGVGQLCAYSWASVLRGDVPRGLIPSVERLRVLERDNATLENLAAVVAALRLLYPEQPVLVIVDYLQGTPAPPGKERGFVANASVDLRRAAKLNRAVVIGVSQASTANAKKLRAGELLGIEGASSGAETAQIERDAYVILTLSDRRVVDPDTLSWMLSVAKYRLGVADVVQELHYRGRTGRWEPVGEPISGADARDAQTTKIDTKKRDELRRSIVALVDASPVAMSKRAITEASTGKDKFISKVIDELIREGLLALVPTRARGGSWPIWTPRHITDLDSGGEV